jgi:hypothetical protein
MMGLDRAIILGFRKYTLNQNQYALLAPIERIESKIDAL